jgi:hypothetical protein
VCHRTYNSSTVQVVSTFNGWGAGRFEFLASGADIKFIALSGTNFQIPTSPTITLTAQGSRSDVERVWLHGQGVLPNRVQVEVRVPDSRDPNFGFVFRGGSVQSSDDDSDKEEYSGVVYVYTDTEVRLYVPNRSNGAFLGKALGMNTVRGAAVSLCRCTISAHSPHPLRVCVPTANGCRSARGSSCRRPRRCKSL